MVDYQKLIDEKTIYLNELKQLKTDNDKELAYYQMRAKSYQDEIDKVEEQKEDLEQKRECEDEVEALIHMEDKE